MVFTVLSACDLGGKCNFELTFPTVPTISELRERIDGVMSQEAALRRSPQAGQFSIHRAQVFDERMEMWVDLVASSQLEDYCQVYVFQKESPWHKDTPGRIPPPTRPVTSSSVPMYARSASPPPYGEGHHAPLYSDLREGSPYSAARSPYRGEQEFSPRSQAHSEGVDNSSHMDKVKMVYDAMDTRNSRAVTLDEWAETFQKVRVSPTALTDATVDDLFHKKADRNEDGVVSFPEFQHFCEVYPKLLESLYFRLKRHGQDTLRQDKLKAQYDQLDDLEKRLDDARQEALDAEAEGLANQQKIDDFEAQQQQAKEDEQDALQAKNLAHTDSENARHAVRDAKQEEGIAKENIKKRDIAKRQAQRAVESQEKKAQAQQAELEKLRKELEVLQRRVADKESEISRQEENISNAERDVEEARSKALDHDDPSLEDEAKQRAQATQAADEDLKQCIANENEKTAAHRNAQRGVSQAAQAKSQAEKEAQAAKIREEQKKKLEQRAERAVEDQKRAVQRNEEKDLEAETKRHEQEEKENDLLQMEVRLREQREAVERKEEHLRGAHRDFSQEAGRNSPRGNYEA
eukprot:TRINITY_DN4714_c0_g2_i1.p1 TRINITY_DN4714_c0_g2~~TRINITY_DN4714_c0_g2_i1.p1  ORF type:complete len:577 (+),score=220.34 TRINITY_DN4714_c0_g2_i1:86-1816(+)